MVKKLAIVVVVSVAAIFIYAATLPDAFHVQRSISIKAPPEKIFAILNDFHQSESWSPYEKKDPAMQRTFGGATNGRGAVYEFAGNNEVGKGRLSITDAVPPSKVTIALDMVEPFETHNIIEYTLQAKGDATDVTWALDGHCPYIGKVLGIFIDKDRMIGKDFEAGLANLKTLAET